MFEYIFFLFIFKNLNWSIIISIVTAFAAIVGIILSLRSIKLTQQLEKDRTRPYIIFYPKFAEGYKYIVIKNFGLRPGKLTGIKCEQLFREEQEQPFFVIMNIVNIIIPPGVSYTIPLRFDQNEKDYTFTIDYNDIQNNNYHEIYKINLNNIYYTETKNN